MKLSNLDIGAEIISILTRGMYQDPRDALREYIQNGVDAHAENVKVKIRQDSIVIEDDGCGMDYQTLRRALRVGVSDKKPGKDVGFMGIGIYSAFHLCDSLVIYSRVKNAPPCKLGMDFREMREVLENQKRLRLQDKISSKEMIDLLSLLEKNISLPHEGTTNAEEFPGPGTRVELSGIAPHFYEELTDFEKIAEYLRDVVPLHFDKEHFTYADVIEKKITDICEKSNTSFELINVELQVANVKEKLFKPYRDEHFHTGQPQKPDFKELREGRRLIGVVWGCLNSSRNRITDKNLRGFLIKKQGFAIGRRENVVKHFGSRTHFDRYIGEVIVVSPELFPTSSREDFEPSTLRAKFYYKLAKVASEFNAKSNEFQDTTKALDDIEKFKDEIKKINAQFNRYERDPDNLVGFIVELNDILTKVKSIIRRKVLKDHDSEEVKKLEESINELIQEIMDTINRLTGVKKNREKQKVVDKQIKIAKDLSSILSGDES